MHEEKLTIASLCGGAVQEKVDRALEKVAKNILDPNTDPCKKRSVTLKITLKPDENDTEDVEVSTEVTYSLAPEVGVSTRFFVNKDLVNGHVTIMEHKKGEIKGQISFGDLDYETEVIGVSESVETMDEETGEIINTESENKILDLRRKKA